jgi:transposase-like protein
VSRPCGPAALPFAWLIIRAMALRAYGFPQAMPLSRTSAFRIGRLENESRETSRETNDMLARAACDFKDDARPRQDNTKDGENEIAIA